MTSLQGSSALITGGAGFIGSHLVDELLRNQGVGEVRVIDNLVNGRRENLELWSEDSRLTLIEADIRDEAAVRDALQGVDTVFHLACLGVRHSLHVNAGATLTLLEAARELEIPRFVHVSSSEVYGTAQYAPMDEKHPTWPETVYGAAKLAGEAYARAAFRTHGYPAVVARPFNTYGPRSHFEGDSGEVIPRTIVRALNGLGGIIFGDGAQTRDFTHVTDTARALAELAKNDEVLGQTINIGSGSEVSINELCALVSTEITGGELSAEYLEARPGDVRRLIVNSSRMHELTGFKTTVTFDDGISELIKWFAAQPESPAEMLTRIERRNWVAEDEDGVPA
jgi:UDP-glucose 4-epimerase